MPAIAGAIQARRSMTSAPMRRVIRLLIVAQMVMASTEAPNTSE
jgi:hypothetical protein